MKVEEVNVGGKPNSLLWMVALVGVLHASPLLPDPIRRVDPVRPLGLGTLDVGIGGAVASQRRTYQRLRLDMGIAPCLDLSADGFWTQLGPARDSSADSARWWKGPAGADARGRLYMPCHLGPTFWSSAWEVGLNVPLAPVGQRSRIPVDSVYTARSLLDIGLDAKAIPDGIPLSVSVQAGWQSTLKGKGGALAGGMLRLDAGRWLALHVQTQAWLPSAGGKWTMASGMEWRLPFGVSLSGWGEKALVGGDRRGGVPAYTLGAGMTWTVLEAPADADGDGVKDRVDFCPLSKEDRDGFQDEDGCPDPDDDGDGIPDLRDACPREPNPGTPRGCYVAPVDTDKDGLPDASDKCPLEAEDLDGYQDEDGCPDLDRDGDGIADLKDACPEVAEDKDGFQDEDGCPDVDNDLDGIEDVRDSCPLLKGPIEGAGCPIGRGTLPIPMTHGKEEVLDGVVFLSGTSELDPESFPLLEKVALDLRTRGGVWVVRSHTDNTGSASANQRLTRRQAEAVREFLIAAGVDPQHLLARGMGGLAPRASNRTPAGRAANRRVDIVAH